ncbi:MAG: hypothetical protein WCO67_12565 [Betaproteobacteria bacterium]
MKNKTLPDAIALLEARDWQGAHEIAQSSGESLAAWAHGIVHLIEGDEANARYWYGQAGRAFPGMGSIDAEIASLKEAMEGQT